jgi:hypothetical protein
MMPPEVTAWTFITIVAIGTLLAYSLVDAVKHKQMKWAAAFMLIYFFVIVRLILGVVGALE